MPLDNITNNKNKKNFLAKFKNKIALYVLFLSLLAGAYIGCSKSPVSPDYDLESMTKIAFVSNRDGIDEIYLMNPDGSNQTRLTYNFFYDSDPAWSPDGSKIAFSSNRYGKYKYYRWDIYVINTDGSNQTRLTYGTVNEGTPSWSPDGSKIAFEIYGEIYVMNHDGSNQIRLTYSFDYEYGLYNFTNFSPTWSPDGSKIAFASNRYGIYEIYVMNADGSNQTRLTYNSAYDSDPAWSPDGSKIAFTSNRGYNNDEIYIINVDGSNQTRLTNNSANDRHPSWSPDGFKIAFVSDRDGNYEIYVMDADGSNQTRLTDGAADNIHPVWSPFLKK